MIKKIKSVHKLATTANLLAMALIMSAGFCDDGDAGGDEVVFTVTPKKPSAISKTDKKATVDVEIKVTAGTVDPTKWTIATKDLKPVKSTGSNGVGGIKCLEEGKNISDAGLKDKVVKDKTGTFKVNLETDKPSFDTGGTNADIPGGKITGELSVKGKSKNTDVDYKGSFDIEIGN